MIKNKSCVFLWGGNGFTRFKTSDREAKTGHPVINNIQSMQSNKLTGTQKLKIGFSMLLVTTSDENMSYTWPFFNLVSMSLCDRFS